MEEKKLSPFFVKDILGFTPEQRGVERQVDQMDNILLETVDDLVDVDAPHQSKKTRQCFTTKQVEELEALFQETSYPDTYTRKLLAKRMRVTDARIQIWFQNKRAKLRRQTKQRKQILPTEIYFQNTPFIPHLPHHVEPPRTLLPSTCSKTHRPLVHRLYPCAPHFVKRISTRETCEKFQSQRFSSRGWPVPFESSSGWR